MSLLTLLESFLLLAVCAAAVLAVWGRNAVLRARRCDDRYRDLLWEYRRLADHIPMQWFGVDPDTGVCKFGNREFREFWKLPGTGEIGKTDFTLHSTGDASELFSLFLSGSGAPNGIEQEIDFPAPDGSRRRGRLYQQLFIRLDGKKVLLCSLTDITESRRCEDEMADLKKLLGLFSEYLPFHFFIRDLDGGNRYRWVSQRLQTDLGFPPGYWIGKSPDAVLPEETVRKIAGEDAELLADRSPRHMMRRRRFADGSEHWMDSTECVLHGATGRWMVGFETDQTEQRESHRLLRRYFDQNRILNGCLESVLLARGEITESAFEPLMRAVCEMLGAQACLLLKFDPGKPRVGLLQRYARAPLDDALVNHFPTGDFSPDEEWVRRLRTRQGLLAPDLMELEEQEACRYWLPLARACALRSLFAFGIFRDDTVLVGALAVVFRGDGPRIFSAADREFLGAATRIVELMRRRAREYLELKRDEQCEQETFDAVAVPVVIRDDSCRAVRANSVARERFGEILESEAPPVDSPERRALENSGVCSGEICHGLSRYRVVASPVGEADRRRVVSTYLEVPDGDPFSPAEKKIDRPGGRKVLLVDDVSMNLRVLEAMFKRLDWTTLSAASGAEALARLRRESADMVFTDLWMPGMDGLALAARIREEPELRHIPVIAVTADTGAVGNAGFDGVLLKPVTLDKLKKLLAALSAHSG